MKNDFVKEMKAISVKLAISQAQKENFKADLSFCKKKVDDFESLEKEHNVLKEERAVAVVELCFVKKHHVQDHNQVDHLLKSKDQIGE